LIVADTNLITYLLLKGPCAPDAEAVYAKDPEWVAPVLWRSEFRNVLSVSLRRAVLSLDAVLGLMDRAERLMQGRGYQTASARILRLAADSGCTSYDCEFVALAQELAIPLVTADTALLAKFRSVAISMQNFCSGS
jgi:predicted nucleic acid-binding protein